MKNTTKTTTEAKATERKWTPEAIEAALESKVKPEGMSNTYWYKLRKAAGLLTEKTPKAPKSEKKATKKSEPKVTEKSKKELELEARRAKYAANKDEINARRRANRAAKKAAKK